MKLLLLAVNSKYIHSNPAVYSLHAYAAARGLGDCVEIAEYTINHRQEDVLKEVYKRKPDVLAVSCYIWNIEFVSAFLRDFNKICPDVLIWLGGPEASYNAERLMEELPFIKGIIVGEGEAAFYELVKYYKEREHLHATCKCDEKCEAGEPDISGTVIRNSDMSLRITAPRMPLDMDTIPFPYEELLPFENRIIYYESSRGCPFNCSYCLSSIEKSLRFRSLDRVYEELKFFLDNKVPQVKFVDRTFNCRHDRTLAIWRFIKENDNGVTNFHFEISADILNAEETELLAGLRPGLVQLEIGVQTTNEHTLAAINRTVNMEKLKHNVEAVYKKRNVHQHLDLIAGLPFEDLESFRHSFAEVYAMKPDQLQLGFLKVLSGTQMSDESGEYEIIYGSRPPYEVLCTKWLSYGDILVLKGIEEAVEIYYNSGQFKTSLKYLEAEYENPFDMYRELSEYYELCGIRERAHSRLERYTLLAAFVKEKRKPEEAEYEYFLECLLYDLYLRDNLKSRPEFKPELLGDKELMRSFYNREAQSFCYLDREKYGNYNARQLARMTHMEWYSHNPHTGKAEAVYVLFDYLARDPLDCAAGTVIIKESELANGCK